MTASAAKLRWEADRARAIADELDRQAREVEDADTRSTPAKRMDVVRMIIADCEADVEKREGQPFNGETVAAYFGETLAMVQALAKVVESMLTEEEAIVAMVQAIARVVQSAPAEVRLP